MFDTLSTTKKPFLFVSSQLAGQSSAYGLTKLMAEKWADQLGGRVARLWNTYGWESPDVRSHVVTDLVLSGLCTKTVNVLTTGAERRRFIYKSDCARMLKSFFDSNLRSVDIAGDSWITISDLASEIGRQLNKPMSVGSLIGDELLVDPKPSILIHTEAISLQCGIQKVIEDAIKYLKQTDAYFEC